MMFMQVHCIHDHEPSTLQQKLSRSRCAPAAEAAAAALLAAAAAAAAAPTLHENVSLSTGKLRQ